MLKKIGHIIRGWGKATGFISTSSAEGKLAELRMRICGGCDFSEHRTWLDLMNGDENGEASGLVCTKCHCPCLQKSLVVDEACPEKFW